MTDQIADLLFILADVSRDSVALADGSLWSHAATLGTYSKGGEFSIDKATIDSFIKNFRKAPVDYEHGTVSGATAAGQPVPKAGDVLELKGVYAAADFSGDLKTVAEKLAAKAGKTLGDPDTLGLWMRWRPTARALRMIQDGEYGDLSIAFAHDYANSKGEHVGPALLSVALTNLPFLDGMLPVAASRNAHPERHRTPREVIMSDKTGGTGMNVLLLSAAAAMVGKAVQSEEEASTILTNAAPEILRLRKFESTLGVELGEVDPDKALTKLRALKTENTEFRDKAATAEKARVTSVVDAAMKEFEDRITPFARDNVFAPQLRAELEKNPALAVKDSVTVKALAELKPHGITKQGSSGDTGTTLSDDPDVKLDQLAKSHLAKDTDLIELRKTDPDAALDQALDRAAKEMKYESQQMKRARESMTIA